jgi:hypothetical protein
VNLLLDQLPEWTQVESIKKEIEWRFEHGDADDLNAKLDRCIAFDAKWEHERVDLSLRLDALRSHFEKMLDHSIKMLSGL